MTRIKRIFADFIRTNPLNPRHPRAILLHKSIIPDDIIRNK